MILQCQKYPNCTSNRVPIFKVERSEGQWPRLLLFTNPDTKCVTAN